MHDFWRCVNRGLLVRLPRYLGCYWPICDVPKDAMNVRFRSIAEVGCSGTRTVFDPERSSGVASYLKLGVCQFAKRNCNFVRSIRLWKEDPPLG